MHIAGLPGSLRRGLLSQSVHRQQDPHPQHLNRDFSRLLTPEKISSHQTFKTPIDVCVTQT